MMRIVAIGGGHGLSATVAAARLLDAHVTAVVSMADDGGSSGRLRDEFAVLPPGDLRMALLALADPAHSTLAQLFGHRFSGDGALGGHSMGNLALTALWQQGRDVVESLRELGLLLNIAGEVLPVATMPHALCATIEHPDGSVHEVIGQARIAASAGRIADMRTLPDTVVACPEALVAIERADLVLLGPGSWFTSVLAPLCVSGVVEAIAQSAANVVLVANRQSTSGEAAGFGVRDYLDSLMTAHPSLRIDAVIAANAAADSAGTGRDVPAGSVQVIDYSDQNLTASHEPEILARSLREAAYSLREGQRGAV